MEIYNNSISIKDYKKAVKKRKKFAKKFGDDSKVEYHLALDTNEVLKDLGTKKLISSDSPLTINKERKPIIIGNIRMGFGHYRIAMAMCSAARSMGYEPLWLDLASFEDTTGSKIISESNRLYSMGSRWSQKYSLFNKLYWEPLNSIGFAKLSYNASDLEVAKLMTPIFRDLPKDIPFIGTHAWTAQAAIAAGMTNVVNAIPDNWPMALHLAPGAIHAVQTPSAYWGYLSLRNMCESPKSNMPSDDIVYTGHYIDHELVSNIEKDCDARIKRANNGEKVRILLTVGGAGAQSKLYEDIINKFKDRAVVLVNVGDHKEVIDEMSGKFKGAEIHENYEEIKKLKNLDGIHFFYNDDIFQAVYVTNLLMRECDVLLTKPSELAYYPVPKLMLKRVGGHEAWGAIRSAEIGDGTYECDSEERTYQLLSLLVDTKEHRIFMNENIKRAAKNSIYDGAYNVIKQTIK
jgi:hypothetical protein